MILIDIVVVVVILVVIAVIVVLVVIVVIVALLSREDCGENVLRKVEFVWDAVRGSPSVIPAMKIAMPVQ